MTLFAISVRLYVFAIGDQTNLDLRTNERTNEWRMRSGELENQVVDADDHRAVVLLEVEQLGLSLRRTRLARRHCELAPPKVYYFSAGTTIHD